MMYKSTRDKTCAVSAAAAITQGISKDGGLFVPESLPKLTAQRIESLIDKSYIDRACDMLGDFLTDFGADEIRRCVTSAYDGGKFEHDRIAPISKLNDGMYLLELFHGPTCAFKDMALQLLPHLLTLSAKKTVGDMQIAILVATSGDTGKAALEGFKDVDGTRIFVFYPKDGVSDIQRLQMTTQEGENLGVCAVAGNFDDTQTAVKQIFTDPAMAERLKAKNIMFSSANSINWGRLVPQICYYISAYCDLVSEGELKSGEKLNVCVPTGNFGNILAAYYAKKMGLPLGKLICASNINNVLTDFIRTGTYDRRREFVTTSSPSMDILISSNLERLLFALYGEDDRAVSELMSQLSKDGVYSVSEAVKSKLDMEFYGGFCDEAATAAEIRETFETYSYLCDTHTAVGLAVANEYKRETGDKTKILVASTASPYKFAGSILKAITGNASDLNEFEQAEKLAKLTSTQIPESIMKLRGQPVRFDGFCEKTGMKDYVCGQLNI